MLGDITAADEIYIVTGRTDMRKSIDGLCAIVDVYKRQMQNRPIFRDSENKLPLFCDAG